MSTRNHAEDVNWVEPELSPREYDILRASAFLNHEDIDEEAARILGLHLHELEEDGHVQQLLAIIGSEREQVSAEVEEAISHGERYLLEKTCCSEAPGANPGCCPDRLTRSLAEKRGSTQEDSHA